ncbi:tetratricopeptide repeat protein [[Pseudopropionibacterium] massiliense]|uniref:tetratricopeptide repeat protein n=1 Tax=[Pseudopropionibacterium] massiliense TaxID=2220000 RepID=UPI0013EEFF7F|nr:tetratricopeptide repeat protein [[Pseudopropionibacterium] massiliense]
MIRRAVWYSGADPARLAEYVPTGAVTHMIPSRNRHELPGPDGRPAADKAKAIFELMARLGIRYVLEPADSQPGVQFVRPVEEVFRASGQGTCLDLCVAFSSAALDAGLHPMILTVIKSSKDRHSIVLIPRNRTWSASGRPEPIADSEVVHEPFLLDDMPLKAMVYRTATGSGELLAIDVQQASRKPDGTPLGDWESAASRGADFLTGETGWDWDVCVDIGALRGTMEAPHSIFEPPRARVLEPGYLKPAPGATRSPLQLIKARTGIVPFTGRDNLTELTDWANKQPGEGREDLAVAVVTGVGGSGKTRLAAELCSNLEKNGWVAGFIPKSAELSEAELTWLTRVESHLLLVLDYAEESHKEELTRLLRRLRERGAPTRVVLTARSAGAWLDDLLEDDALSGAMAQGLFRVELPRQAEISSRMAKKAAKRFARYLETPEPTDVEIPQNSRWTTLDFVLHGWLIASEVDTADLPSSRERLYEDILRREIEYWQDEAARQGMAKVSEATLRTSAAVLSLIGPRTVPETTDVLSRLPDWSDINLRKTYAELLSTVLADPGEAYVLRPDPVAEKLVVEVFVDDGETLDVPEELLDKVLPPDPLSDSRLNETTCPPAITRRAEAHKAQSKHACEAITRCTSQGDAPAEQLAHSALRCRTHLWASGLEAALRQGGPFVPALEDALKGGMDIPAAEIANSIPLGHAYLRGVAVAAMIRDQEKDMNPAERAAYMNNLSGRLSEVGDRAGAVKAVREAVEIRRGLAKKNPTAFNPDLARALSNLSGCLSKMGDREGAVKAVREAVEIRRGLAKKNRAAFNPDLATSLNNLSVMLSKMGDREDALKAAREAVEIRHRLAKKNRAAFNPDLAASLNNLSGCLSELGDCEGAVKAAREAVGIYRGLAEENAAAFNPLLAMSLNNLSGCLFEVGDRVGAVKAAREAVGIYRGPAEESPAAFNPDLAMSLSNLSIRLFEVGDREDAVKAAREAVGIYRGLAEENAAAFNPDLAGVLSNLSVMLPEVGDRAGAVNVVREAVEIRRGLAEKNPTVFKPVLAGALSNLSGCLSEVGDRAGAVKAVREAVEIRRGLAKKNPTAFNPDLARALSNLSVCLSKMGDREGAVKAVREAVEIRRGLAKKNRAAFNPDLATSLNNLSVMLSKMGDREDALKAAREAVEIRHRLAMKNRAAFNPDLAASLNNLSIRLFEVGDRVGALNAIWEAVEIRRGLAEKNPTVFNPDLAASLNNLSIRLFEVGDRVGALNAIWEAVEIRRGLAEKNPTVFNPDLAASLNNLSIRLFEVGDRVGALNAIWEAVEIRRGLAEKNPTVFNPDLADSLSNLSVMLSGVGYREGALKAVREAVGIRRGLAEKNPTVFNPDLADSLSNLSVMLSGVGYREDALKAVREAVEIQRGLAAGNAAAFSPDLATSLNNLSNCLSEVGDLEDALKAVREAVEIQRGLAAGNAAAFSPDLATSLNNLSNCLSEVGDRGGALEVVREAVEIYRGLAAGNAAAFEADLVRALNTLARILTETGVADEALRCFTDETESFSTGLQARLWLAKARWRGEAGGVDDLCHAAELADTQDDPRLLGKVRRAIAETASKWQAAIHTKWWEKLPDWAIYDLSEHLETLHAWLQCTNWDDQARLLRSAWPAPTEDDVALVRAAAKRYVDVPEMSTLAGIVEAIAEQGLEPVLSERQAIYEAGALVIGWRTAHADRKGRQYLKKHQNMAGNPHCREVLQRLGLPDEERESLLALLDLATVSSVDLAYDVAEDLDDADDAIRDFIDAANVPGMHCALRVRPDLAEATPHGRFAATLCAYLTGHPEEGKRYLDLIGTIANPDDRESFRRCVHTLGRDPDYADALAPVAEWLRTG